MSRSARTRLFAASVCASLLSPAAAWADFAVRGLVRYSSGRPAADARVSIPELRKAVLSDEGGRFVIAIPREGFYTLRVDSDERTWYLRKRLGLGSPVELMLVRREDESEPEASFTVEGLMDRTRLSRYRLHRDEIRRLPGAYGDSLRAVAALPGVTATLPPGSFPSVNILGGAQAGGGIGLGPPYRNNFVNGFLVIRGAGPLSNSFLFDGFRMHYPFHLGDQSSVLNNEMIRSLDVYTGTFPARYGDAAGGVIAVTGPAEVKRPAGHVNLALFLADAYLEAPIPGGFVAGAGRRSYPNYTLLRAYPDGIPADAKYASYRDGQLKLAWDLARGHRLSVVHFGTRDIQRYTRAVGESTGSASGFSADLSVAGALDTNSDTRPPIDLDRGFTTSGLRYDARLGSAAHNNLLVELSDFREDFKLDFRSPLTGEVIFGFQVLNAKHELHVRDELAGVLIENRLLARVGGEWTRRRWELSLANLSPRQSTNPNTPGFIETINRLVDENRTFRALYDGDRTEYDLQSGYAELEVQWGRLRLLPGIRSDYFSLSGSTGVGPRLAGELPIGDSHWTLVAGAGRHFNVPPSLEQVSVESGNPFLAMEQADRAAGGVEWKRGSWLLKVEYFANQYENLVVEDGFAYRALSPRLNRRDLVEKEADLRTRPVEARPLFYSNDGTGWSRGAELHVKKVRRPDEDGWFGWISYTYSISKRNNHQPRLTDDERNRLSVRNRNRNVWAAVRAPPFDLIYYDSAEFELVYDNDREELYDLDRTHQVTLVFNYRFNARHQLGARWRYADNVPVTPVVGSETVGGGGVLNRPTFIPRYSTAYNSERLPPTHQLDVRYDYFLRYSFGYANYFVEFINLYARRNEEPQQFSSFNFLYPYNRGTNPAPGYESTYIGTPIGRGRILRLPLINIGLEVKF